MDRKFLAKLIIACSCLLWLVGFTKPEPVSKLLIPVNPNMNQISFELWQKQWVKSDTAKIIVTVNANLKQDSLANFYQQLPAQLAKLDKQQQWHITHIQSNKDQAGMEQITVTAQTRMSIAQLPKLRGFAKTLSHAGQTYRISSIQFTPSKQQIAHVQAQLRAKIYQQVQQELNQVNKMFPKEQYFLHKLKFSAIDKPARPITPVMYNGAVLAKKASGHELRIAASKPVELKAEVVLANTN